MPLSKVPLITLGSKVSDSNFVGAFDLIEVLETLGPGFKVFKLSFAWPVVFLKVIPSTFFVSLDETFTFSTNTF